MTTAFALAGICPAAKAQVSAGAPPAWVLPLPVQADTNAADADAGRDSRLLLEDSQINGQTDEVFNHVARQFWTSTGAQSHSQLAVDFDTNSQSLVVHWVQVWRGTNVVNKMDLEDLKFVTRERDLEHTLFNGAQTAVLPLMDVRQGDILDYAYTIRGGNPADGGKFSHLAAVQEEEPADRLTTRLLWPNTRPLGVKNKDTDAAAVVVKEGDLTQYTWDRREAPGIEEEEPLPAWYYPLPWVQLSESQSWSDVNKWELGVFTNISKLSPELTRQIELWRRLPDAAAQVAAVLRFLQDEVRNQAVDSPAEDYRPASPSVVFDRRFGDGKDKALLFTTILQKLGIEAWPVLVATSLRQSLHAWLPTPTQFDHVIVQVTLDGQTYYLDPMGTFQRGPLAARSWPNYGRGLVVRPGTTELAVISESSVRPKTTMTEFFFLRQLPLPTDLKVVTVADGPDAEEMRRQFAANGRAALQGRDSDRIGEVYPNCEVVAPTDYADDEEHNEVTTTSYFHVSVWVARAGGPGFQAQFFPQNIAAAARRPAVAFRSMPLGLGYPKDVVFRADISPVPAIPVETGNRTVEDPALIFRRSVAAPAGEILIEEEFAFKTDSVSVEALPGYLQDLGQVSEMDVFTLVSPR